MFCSERSWSRWKLRTMIFVGMHSTTSRDVWILWPDDGCMRKQKRVMNDAPSDSMSDHLEKIKIGYLLSGNVKTSEQKQRYFHFFLRTFCSQFFMFRSRPINVHTSRWSNMRIAEKNNKIIHTMIRSRASVARAIVPSQFAACQFVPSAQ